MRKAETKCSATERQAIPGPPPTRRISPAARILIGLALGLGLGTVVAGLGIRESHTAVQVAATVGGMWLDALRMTILPLVFSLVVTGLGATAAIASSGGVTRLSIGLFAVILLACAALAALLVPALLAFWPAPVPAAAALRDALGHAGRIGDYPGIAAILRGIIPTNVVSAASSGAMLPVVFFAVLFGLGITRIGAAGQAGLSTFFLWIKDVMLIIVGWVLKAAPAGVFALAFVVAVRTGFTALGAFAHFIAIVVLMCLIGIAAAYVVAALAGGVRIAAFARAAAPAQAIALSTQSSLASLPAMLKGCEQLGLAGSVTGVTLPLAVSVFRTAGPLATVTIGIYAAHIMNVPIHPGGLAAAALISVIMVVAGGGGIPSQVTYFATLTPVLASLGVPIELLALLVAVETIPDIFRTTANVSMDMAVTTVVARYAGDDAPAASQGKDEP